MAEAAGYGPGRCLPLPRSGAGTLGIAAGRGWPGDSCYRRRTQGSGNLRATARHEIAAPASSDVNRLWNSDKLRGKSGRAMIDTIRGAMPNTTSSAC